MALEIAAGMDALLHDVEGLRVHLVQNILQGVDLILGQADAEHLHLVAAINEARQSGGGGGGGYQIGSGLKLDAETNTLSVDTAEIVEKDNTKPVTSAAVFAEVGNINALLATI